MATLLPSRSVIGYTASSIKVNSTMLSLGLSTNQTYNNLSNGTYSNWINAGSSLGLTTIKDIAMSSSGQYQLIVVGSSATLYLSSDSGVTWITQGAAGFLGTGLPVVSTAYTYGAISANGQYMLVCVNAGSIYVSSNYGTSFTNASLPSVTATNWFAFENNTSDSIGSIVPTVTGTMRYVTGKVGTYALNLVNTPAGTAVNYLRGSWTAPANCSITGWVCPQFVSGATQVIFNTYGSAMIFYIESTNLFKIDIATSSGTSTTISSTVTPVVNTWYHFAIIFQSYGGCSLYINGTLQGTVANTSGYAGFTNTGLFGLGTRDSTTANAYSGYVDDLRLYNYAIVPSGAPPQNFNFAAMSGTGQYMAVTSPGNVAYSSNYGQTWTTPYGSTTGGQMSGLALSNTGQYMVAQNGGSVVPNSTAATAATWTANGIGWTVSASSNFGDAPPYYAFNATLLNFRWLTSTQSYSPAYSGAFSTTVSGLGLITGEWLQLQSSTPLVLYAYSYGSANFTVYDPTSFYVVGSNDGTTWFPIHYCASMTANPFNAAATPPNMYIPVSYSGTQPFMGNVAVTGNFTTYPSTSSNSYTYFRVIFKSLFSGTEYLGVGEWYYNFSGGVTYSTNYGTSWTNTGTIATIPTSPSAVSGNGQYTLTSIGTTGQTALVTASYVASPYAPGGGCVAYYPFNDPTGATNIAEAIGGYYGSLAGSGTTFGNAGKVGTSMYLNGSGYLTMPSTIYAPWTTLSAGSIACWINPAVITTGPIFVKQTSGQAYYSVLSIGSYSNGSGYIAGTPGKIYFTMSNTQFSAGCSSTTALALNTWCHVVVTFNGTAIQFYINGVLDNTFYCNWTMATTPTTMVLGVTGVYYTGFIDDFSLWNVALTQSTITALYNSISPTLTSINSAIVGTALSYTGQYQVLVTGGATNNVYYSSNYGQTFTGITVGSSLTLLGCTASHDGSYITVYTTSAIYTLNNNRSGNSVAIGNAAGSINQGANAISIGTYASLTNQVGNSIVLNATGSTLNANTAGLFVSPIQPASAMGVSSINLLGYGSDNQVVTTGPSTITVLSNGNVGINTVNPSATLQIVGSIAKSSGTFDISHPLYPGTSKRLVHSFIEGPRCDLVYRGTTTLVLGVGTVDINKECTYDPIGSMDAVTFEVLCTNPQVFLQNNSGFDKLIWSISGGTLTITSDDATSTATVGWMVVAERADPFIKLWDRTDTNGLLITQYSSAF